MIGNATFHYFMAKFYELPTIYDILETFLGGDWGWVSVDGHKGSPESAHREKSSWGTLK